MVLTSELWSAGKPFARSEVFWDMVTSRKRRRMGRMIRTSNTMVTWHDRGAAFCLYVCVKLVPEHLKAMNITSTGRRLNVRFPGCCQNRSPACRALSALAGFPSLPVSRHIDMPGAITFPWGWKYLKQLEAGIANSCVTDVDWVCATILLCLCYKIVLRLAHT